MEDNKNIPENNEATAEKTEAGAKKPLPKKVLIIAAISAVAVIALVAVLVFALGARKPDGGSGGNDNEGIVYGVSADGTYAEVLGYDGTAKKVKIASEYEGLPVKNIYDDAFKENDTITSVIIPDSVTSIGYRAFYYCSSLVSVVIPDSVTSIGEEAFLFCDSLESVVIPDSVTSIGEWAFSGCNSALYTEYEYGKYVKSGDNPYAVLVNVTNENLSTYTIHEDTKIIAGSAFNGCSRLTSITIPDGVRGIGERAFYDCSSLRDVYYTGTEEEWGQISIEGENSNLTSATKH